jgi:hypothetical protein
LNSGTWTCPVLFHLIHGLLLFCFSYFSGRVSSFLPRASF